MHSQIHTKFRLGQIVRKTTGSEWSGRVVGFYSTNLTPEGYCVESFMHLGAVQIYPARALELVERPSMKEIMGAVCQSPSADITEQNPGENPG